MALCRAFPGITWDHWTGPHGADLVATALDLLEEQAREAAAAHE